MDEMNAQSLPTYSNCMYLCSSNKTSNSFFKINAIIKIVQTFSFQSCTKFYSLLLFIWITLRWNFIRNKTWILFDALALICTFTSFNKANWHILIHTLSWIIIPKIHRNTLLIPFLDLKLYNSRNTTPK